MISYVSKARLPRIPLSETMRLVPEIGGCCLGECLTGVSQSWGKHCSQVEQKRLKTTSKPSEDPKGRNQETVRDGEIWEI